ncbi:TPA_asm: P3 [Vicia betacytorhabdovirus 1]|nr:TPA_asm: P3 [Vicia betacytorhabdovirus 1]
MEKINNKILLLRNEQHETERTLSFPFSLTEWISAKRYACLRKLSFEYIPIIQNNSEGYIEIRVIDMRRPTVSDSRISVVRIFSTEYQTFTVENLEWTLRRDNCPWKIEIVSKVSDIENGVAIGDLKIRPQFVYTNSKPERNLVTVKVIKTDPKITIRKVPSALNYLVDAKSFYVMVSPLLPDLIKS